MRRYPDLYWADQPESGGSTSIWQINPRKEPVMTEERKEISKEVLLPRKTYWHLYSLQSIQTEKLAKIVNQVLRNECILIK